MRVLFAATSWPRSRRTHRQDKKGTTVEGPG